MSAIYDLSFLNTYLCNQIIEHFYLQFTIGIKGLREERSDQRY